MLQGADITCDGVHQLILPAIHNVIIQGNRGDFDDVAYPEYVAQQITEQAFYKRVGFWCRQCEFLPLCLGNKKKAKDTLVRIT